MFAINQQNKAIITKEHKLSLTATIKLIPKEYKVYVLKANQMVHKIKNAFLKLLLEKGKIAKLKMD